jgi:hypothetical protein
VKIEDLIANYWTSSGGSGDGGSGNGEGGSGESPEEKTAREAREAEAARSGSGSGNNNDLVPKREVQEANREAQNLRERAKKAEDELAAIKTAQLSDTEKVQKERDDAKAAQAVAEKRSRDLQVQVIAQGLGVVDPSAAASLLNWENVSDPDDPKAVEKALRELVKDKPWLAGNTGGGGDGGAGDGSGAGRGGQNMNDLIRGASGRR